MRRAFVSPRLRLKWLSKEHPIGNSTFHAIEAFPNFKPWFGAGVIEYDFFLTLARQLCNLLPMK
jgi:hypothetical protein